MATFTLSGRAGALAGSPLAAPPRSARAVLPARHARVAVQAKKDSALSGVEIDSKTGVAKGLKWDGANLRWVKREGAYFTAVVQPKSGAAYTIWPLVFSFLTDKGLKSLSASEAAKQVKSGKAILVDVRDPISFEKEHAEGAINVPLFRVVQGNSPFDIAKKVVMAGFAMTATERNPNFAEDALAALPKNKKIIVACSIGGTLVTTRSATMKKKVFADPERAFGRESRSLKACYELMQAGFKPGNVVHLDGGVQQWRYQKFPVVKK